MSKTELGISLVRTGPDVAAMWRMLFTRRKTHHSTAIAWHIGAFNGAFDQSA